MATSDSLSQKRISKKNGILAWHWLADGGKTAHGEEKIVVAGKTMKVQGPVLLCSHGYHASIRPLDALQYAPGAMVQRVLMWGEVKHDDDKLVASNRTCLWVADATRTLHEFAIWTAEQAIELMRSKGVEPDPRSINALQVKRMWLDGKATDDDLEAARESARAAAWESARAAAWAAAWAAARESAWAARESAWAARESAWESARAARESARESARAARESAWEEQNKKLEAMLLALESAAVKA